MLDLPEYIIRDEVCEDFRTKTYRGWSKKRHAPVLIKVPKHETVSLSDISSLVYEYEVARDLEIEGIVRAVELVEASSTLAVVLEDTGALPLGRYTKGKAVHIHDFFDIALRLAEILGRLHRKGLVHRNLCPETIFVHPESGKVSITGFAMEVQTENLKLVIESVNPAYMAPEQTGLTAYGVDHRTDLYSLGIVFYQLLTGRLPLEATSPAGWIWVLTTQEPSAANAVNPRVPRGLSEIVVKMLSKIPDDRYQSSLELIHDLTDSRDLASAEKQPERPGVADAGQRPRFSLSRKLFGRQEQEKTLKAALDQACTGGGGVVLVSGEAGTGKTMLVNEVLRTPAIEKGYYGYGKAGRIKQNNPYSLFASAMEMVIEEMVSDSEDNLAIWKSDILGAVRRNGAVVTELFPDIEVITGPQPKVEVLQPKEAQNRLFMTLSDFTGIFGKRGTPLVLFVDDLQWADRASLQLLRYLSRNARYLLIVGAYRDNEVKEDDALADFIRRVRQETSVTEIHLDPLSEEDVVGFVADTLSCPPERAKDLADVLGRKTYRNPFFLGQALQAIYDENIIRLNERVGCWEWEIESVKRLPMPEDVVELIQKRLERLPGETLDLLKLASCLGHTFWLRPLSIVCNKTVSEISALMTPAMREGLVFLVSEEGGDWQLEFVHDEIEEAVYSLIPEVDRKKMHLRFGRVLMREVLPDDPDDRLLPIMDHVNRGLGLLEDPAERLRFAEYNLLAGRKAKASVAHDSALSYFTAGIELLPQKAWDEYYRLCYDLHLECAQCEHMVGGTVEAERLFDTLLHHAKTENEKIDIHSMKMLLYTATGDYERALEIGTNTLKALGMDMPRSPGLLDKAKEVLLYRWLMLNKRLRHLVELPEMRHARQRKVTDVLVKFILVTCSNYPDLYAFAAMKAGNHALEHGSTEMAPVGYLGFGIVEGSVLGNYRKGYELGKAAVSVAERYGTSFTKSIVYFSFGAIINHWTHHLRDGLDYLQKSIDYALRAGEVLIAGWAYGVILENKYLLGTPLTEVLEEAQKCNEYGRRVQHENLKINAWVYEKVASTLTNWRTWRSSEDAWHPSGIAEGDKASLATRYFCAMQTCYLKGEYETALSIMEELKACIGAIMGFMLSAECIYYHSLAIAGAYPRVFSREQKRLMRDLKTNRRKMKIWAESCPDNFSHKYLLVKAETLRILGKTRKAESLYEQAIESAGKNGYIQDQAIACELAALFSIAGDRPAAAKAYMSEAHKLYRKWGAIAKAQDLRMRYPELLEGLGEYEGKGQISTDLLKNVLEHYDGPSGGNSDHGTNTIQEAAKSLAGEVEPRKALRTFLGTVMDMVYANRAFLLLEKDGELAIHFAGDAGQGVRELTEPLLLEETDQLSRSTVRLVFRTLRPVIVDGDHLGGFAKDKYMRKAKPKSVAGIPLMSQGVPVGVLYLENTLISGIFTTDRLELVGLLANRLVYARAFEEFLKHDGNDESLGESLTDRELEILRLISEGLSNREIAYHLDLTVNTVKTHIKSIYCKLRVNGRVQAVKRGQELRLL